METNLEKGQINASTLENLLEASNRTWRLSRLIINKQSKKDRKREEHRGEII